MEGILLLAMQLLLSLTIFKKKDLFSGVEAIGRRVLEQFGQLQEAHSVLGDVRGLRGHGRNGTGRRSKNEGARYRLHEAINQFMSGERFANSFRWHLLQHHSNTNGSCDH